MKTIDIKSGERIDELLRNGYRIIQDPQRFCFGMDAVLLSGYAKAKPGERVIDFCTGNGVVPILMEAKTSGEKFFGLEIQEESADLARRSVMLNELEEKIEIVTGDIKEAVNIFGAASFHVVTMNPPYMTGNHGLVNPSDAKAIARHEISASLEEMISQASKVLKDRGRFYMVHRPFRLAEIMTLMVKYRLEPKRMRLVYPYVDREPNMVLIEGLKGGNSRITVDPPLIVYEKPGVYTKELRELYDA